MVAIMMVLELPPSESLRSHVSTESRYGMKTWKIHFFFLLFCTHATLSNVQCARSPIISGLWQNCQTHCNIYKLNCLTISTSYYHGTKPILNLLFTINKFLVKKIKIFEFCTENLHYVLCQSRPERE